MAAESRITAIDITGPSSMTMADRFFSEIADSLVDAVHCLRRGHVSVARRLNVPTL